MESTKQYTKMSDLIQFLDEVTQKYFNMPYLSLQTLEQYSKFDIPLRTQKSLYELQTFLNSNPLPSKGGIAYNIVILSLSEKNFVPELVQAKMPNANTKDIAIKDLILAIKSNLYGLFKTALDELSDKPFQADTIIKNYLNKRIETVEQAFSMPSKYITQFKNGQIQLKTALAFANNIIEHFQMNFEYVSIAPQNMLYYRLPYQPNYKVKELSENILAGLHSEDPKKQAQVIADSYEYILELANTEENIVGLRKNIALDTARKNIATSITALRTKPTDIQKLREKIEQLFSSYFKEREIIALKTYNQINSR